MIYEENVISFIHDQFKANFFVRNRVQLYHKRINNHTKVSKFLVKILRTFLSFIFVKIKDITLFIKYQKIRYYLNYLPYISLIRPLFKFSPVLFIVFRNTCTHSNSS